VFDLIFKKPDYFLSFRLTFLIIWHSKIKTGHFKGSRMRFERVGGQIGVCLPLTESGSALRGTVNGLGSVAATASGYAIT